MAANLSETTKSLNVESPSVDETLKAGSDTFLHKEDSDEEVELFLKLASGETHLSQTIVDTFGDLQTAINSYELCLKITRDVGDRLGEGRAYSNLGHCYWNFGDSMKALECYEHCLKIAKEMKKKNEEGVAYGNVGICYHRLGEFQKALNCHQIDLAIAKEFEDSCGQGRAYANLGSVYQSRGDFKTALDYHQRYLNIARGEGDKLNEGIAYTFLGDTCRSLGNFEKAKEYYDRGLQIAREEGDKVEEGRVYCSLGNTYCSTGEFDKAKDCYEVALKVAKDVGNKAEVGIAYGNLGIVFTHSGDFKQALEYHELQLQIAKQLEDKLSKGLAYSNIGNDHHGLGDFKRAIHYHELFLKVAEEVGDRASIGRAYGNLGNAYSQLADFKRAIDYYELDLDVCKEIGDKHGEGEVYGNIGTVYHCIGDFEKAAAHHKRHLEIAKKLSDRAGEGVACANLGIALFHKGDLKTAIRHHRQGLKIAKEVGDRVGVGKACGNLGIAYCALGDMEQAMGYFKDDLKIAKETCDRAGEGDAYANLGKVCYLLEDYQLAKRYYQLCLVTTKQVQNRCAEGRAYLGLGYCHASLNSLSEAEECFRAGVGAFNDVRRRVKDKDEWNINFVEVHKEAYKALMHVLIKQENAFDALSVAEQGRSQALKDLLFSNYGIKTAGCESYSEEQVSLKTFNSNSSSTLFIALSGDYILLWIIAENVVKLELVEISQDLAEDTNALMHCLVKSAYETNGVRAWVKCEDRSLDALTNETLPIERSSGTESPSTDHDPQTNALQILYDVLIEPIAKSVHGDELIIVPEGPLWLAPFAAFVDSNSRCLSESFSIRVIPSLSTLKLVVDCPPEYHSKSGALLVGDPWVQDLSFHKGKRLEQLPYARKEVVMIGQILDTKPLVGTEATKDAVLKQLSSVSLVHIAAHGRMERGEIVLAPNSASRVRSSQVSSEEDYLLTISDVLSVKLTARLVVLSCCHSGRGEIKADGVVGIARAFLGAGARSVLVSLWAIDDEATLQFMNVFYQQLREGKSSSKALNQAMKSMRESDRFNAVKYWASFVLIGDDVTLEFGGSK